MEVVQCYKTIDKKFFENEDKALRHERTLKFTNTLKGSGKKTKAEINTLIRFINDNKDSVLGLLNAEEK